MTEQEEFEFRLRLEREQAVQPVVDEDALGKQNEAALASKSSGPFEDILMRMQAASPLNTNIGKYLMAAPEERAAMTEQLAGRTRAFGSAATLGVTPHLEAAVRPGGLPAVRADEAAYEQSAPMSEKLGLAVGGGVLGGNLALKAPVVGSMLKEAIGIGKPMSWWEQTKRVAPIAGAAGATQGFMGNDKDRSGGAQTGAMFGAGAGAVVPAVSAIIPVVGKALKGLTPAGKLQEAERLGFEELIYNTGLDKMGEKDFFQHLATLGNDQRMGIYHVMLDKFPQSNTAKYIRAMGIQPRANMTDSSLKVFGDVETAKDALVRRLAESSGDVKGRLRAEEEYINNILNSGKPFYKQAYMEGARPIDLPAVNALLDKPWVRRNVLPAVLQEAVDEGRQLPFKYTVRTYKSPLGDEMREIVPESKLDLEGLDLVQRQIRGYISDQLQLSRLGQGGVDKARAAKMREPLDKALKELEEAFPTWGMARKNYGDASELKQAFDLSKQFRTMSADDVRFSLENLSTAGKKAFRQSVMNDEVVRLANEPRNVRGTSNKIDKSDELESKYRQLFDDPKEATMFMQDVRNHNLFADVKNSLTEGSATRSNVQADLTLSEVSPSAGGNIWRNPWPAIAQMIGKSQRQMLRVPQEEVAAQVVNAGLMNTGPRGLERTFDLMRKYRGLQDAARMRNAERSVDIGGGLLGGYGTMPNSRERR